MNIDLPSLTLHQVCDLQSAQTLVLSVNNRHARRILADLSAQLNEQRQVMTLPDILPLSAWLQQASDHLSFMPDAPLALRTLDGFGAACLWQQVIEDAEEDHVLLDVNQAARLAVEADRLVSEWELTVNPEHETSDYQRFTVWREEYRSRLSALDAEDSNLAYEHICRAAQSGQLHFPYRNIILAGFTEFSPRFSGLIGTLEQQGVSVFMLKSDDLAAQEVQRVMASDPDAEWRLAARWAQTQLRQNPQGRYAIVAAQLEGDVVLAHRVLRQALQGDAAGPALAYNIAVARPLSDWPLVRAAMAWLRVLRALLQKKNCAPVLAGEALLAGGCVADAAEASGRAIIDALWRKKAVVNVSGGELMQRLAQWTPQLAQAWSRCVDEHANPVGKAGIDTWVVRFKQWLQQLGFPGDLTLDSHAYQVLEAFDGVLQRLSQQSLVLGNISFGETIAALSNLARETPFQPQRDPAARLDVQGFLEAEGGRWDGVWVLGLTDEVLPAVPKPNPLIPLATLRLANAPRATPERELHWAQSLYASLLRCAPAVWLSYPQHEGERLLRPSPYIAGLPLAAVLPELPPPAPCLLDCVVDEQGPALPVGGVTRGGIGVIDTQARNPLWAFVKYRLGASQLSDYAELSDQNARGVFLHKAIELVWGQVGNQDELRSQHEDGSLSELIHQSVQAAADQCLQDYSPVLKALEADRALTVVDNWLMLELAREPFAIQAIEQDFQWSHGALELTLRLDRIDVFSDGRLGVIDYKTGAGNIDPKSNWMRMRPVGLQLPFYAAVLADEHSRVAALILAQLHAKKTLVKGLADADYGFEGLASLSDWPEFAAYSWDQLMAQWRQTIQDLAQEYASGVARNNSVRRDDLSYCDVLPFLRLNEEAVRVQ